MATRFLTGQREKLQDGTTRDAGMKEFWAVWASLIAAGLIEYVPHLIEADTEDAQILHAYGADAGEDVERRIAVAAHKAGLRMVTEGQHNWAYGQLENPPCFCPVRSHISNVQLVGIARLKHRPHTKRTAAWARAFIHEAERICAVFESMSEKPVASTA